jgi:drug/metabolite transporter (DMT)-like permease
VGTLIGPLLALGSALSWGVADFAGGMYSRRYPSAAVVGISQAWSFVALVLVLVFAGAPTGLGWLPWSVLAGVAGSVGLVAFYRALAFGTVGVVSPISALGAAIPVMVGLFGGEEPRTGQLVGIGLALLGAVLASGPELRGEEPVKAQAIGFAALAAAGLGIAMLAIAGARHIRH